MPRRENRPLISCKSWRVNSWKCTFWNLYARFVRAKTLFIIRTKLKNSNKEKPELMQLKSFVINPIKNLKKEIESKSHQSDNFFLFSIYWYCMQVRLQTLETAVRSYQTARGWRLTFCKKPRKTSEVRLRANNQKMHKTTL